MQWRELGQRQRRRTVGRLLCIRAEALLRNAASGVATDCSGAERRNEGVADFMRDRFRTRERLRQRTLAGNVAIELQVVARTTLALARRTATLVGRTSSGARLAVLAVVAALFCGDIAVDSVWQCNWSVVFSKQAWLCCLWTVGTLCAFTTLAAIAVLAATTATTAVLARLLLRVFVNRRANAYGGLIRDVCSGTRSAAVTLSAFAAFRTFAACSTLATFGTFGTFAAFRTFPSFSTFTAFATLTVITAFAAVTIAIVASAFTRLAARRWFWRGCGRRWLFAGDAEERKQ
jgi:hypothetical protein